MQLARAETAAQAETAAKQEAVAAKQEAVSAKERATDKLWDSYLATARAGRMSKRLGVLRQPPRHSVGFVGCPCQKTGRKTNCGPKR